MSYDGIVMRAVSLELNACLAGARIDKIYQPAKSELVLHLRQPGRQYRLLLTAAAQDASVYLCSKPKSNPAEAPLFCMLLRKHLEGGRISEVSQQGLERVLEITAETHDELGDKVRRKLIIEVMGKHSNIILIDPAANKILDSIHRIPASVSSYRQVLPGLSYAPPPPQKKAVPWEVQEDTFIEGIMGQPLSQKLSKVLLSLFAGFGPQSCEEILFRAGLNPVEALEFCGEYELSKLWQAFNTAALDIKDGIFCPEVIVEGNKPTAFSALMLSQYAAEKRKGFSTMNEALDYYYSYKQTSSLFQQKKNDIAQVIRREIDRCEKKAGFQQETIREAKDAEQYRLWGELLTANQYQLSQGQEVIVRNYYDPDEALVKIPLEESLSILDNAQRYFKKYQKARNAARQVQSHLAETEQELQYLQSISASLENITILDEAEEIRLELQEAGYIKAPVQKRKGKAAPIKEFSRPDKLNLQDWEISFGKNNKQNDYLTMKQAKQEDTWLHTKDIPGSHVIIKNPYNKPIPSEILETAALIAAYNSKARYSSNVPVDYTLKKNVWKQKGAKPGMVHYDNQRTIHVTPSADKINRILTE